MSNINHLVSNLKAGRMSRREFMSAAVALGVSAAAATSLATDVLAAPKKGGTLKAGCGGANTIDTLDGATHTDIFMQMFGMGMVFDCLTEIKADGSLTGELAESWDASDDAVTWTFKLKKGVEFHNGKSFGADDVIASLRHHMGEKSKSAAKPIVDNISEMKKDDDHTVQFVLNSGNADFPYLVSDYHLLIYPAEGMQEAMKTGNGTGGYKMVSFDPGVRGIAKRNENYHKSNCCWFDSVEMIAINDASSRMNALMTGEIDVMNRVDIKTAHLLKRNKRVKIFEVTGNQHYSYPMITKQAPFDNNDVRLALKYAFDRDELVKKILKGHGIAGIRTNFGRFSRSNTFLMEQRTYDPEKAKFHLKKAGMENLKLDISASDAAFGGAVDATVLYKESAAKAGIELNVIREPKDGYWSNVWLKKPYVACFWSGRPTEDWMFSNAYAKGVPWNDSYWEHEKFNKLLVEGRATVDPNKRREIYHEMQQIVRDEGGVAIPMFANWVDASNDKLAHGEQLGNSWQLDGARLAERWWFA